MHRVRKSQNCMSNKLLRGLPFTISRVPPGRVATDHSGMLLRTHNQADTTIVEVRGAVDACNAALLSDYADDLASVARPLIFRFLRRGIFRRRRLTHIGRDYREVAADRNAVGFSDQRSGRPTVAYHRQQRPATHRALAGGSPTAADIISSPCLASAAAPHQAGVHEMLERPARPSRSARRINHREPEPLPSG